MLNIECEFAPTPKLKSVVTFRLPFACTGGGSSCDGDEWNTYQPQYIMIRHCRANPQIFILSGNYGCSWIDATDEETIDYILTHLADRGYTDIVIEEKQVIDIKT